MTSPYPPRHRRRALRPLAPANPALAAAMLAIAVLASGCSTPPDYFHTLRPRATDAPVSAGTPVRAGTRVLAVGPVTVPDALVRNEWVIRVGDTGARVYDHQLWTQGLAAEIAQSLTDYLNRGTPTERSKDGAAFWADAGPTGSGSGADLSLAPTLRVRVQALRFDSLLSPAPAIGDQLRWTLECLPSDKTLSPVESGRYRTVRSAVREVVGEAPADDLGVDEGQRRYDRLARAHSAALKAVADDIAAALRDSAADRARDCVPAPAYGG